MLKGEGMMVEIVESILQTQLKENFRIEISISVFIINFWPERYSFTPLVYVDQTSLDNSWK